MKKSIILIPFCAVAFLISGHSYAQTKTKINSSGVAVPANNAPAVDLTGIVDKTPKDDTPLEAAIRDADAVVETAGKGTINWTAQYVEATGTSVLDTERFPNNKAQAKAMATRGAVVDAQRNLLETIKGVQVTGETTIENFMTTSDKVTTKVQGIIKGAYQVGPARTTPDGAIEVTMRVPLYAKNGLAPAVIDQVPAAIQEQTQEMQSVVGATASAATETAPVEMASGARISTPATAKTSSGATTGLTTESGKPIVFNLQDKKIDPSMFPVIFDQNGKVVLDMSKLYDPNKGQFPKILQSSKELMKNTGFKKGVEIIDLLQDKATGQLRIADTNKTKVNWSKIGNVAGKIASFLLLLV
jgi:hypothetical protein